jgi:hypothetical protein
MERSKDNSLHRPCGPNHRKDIVAHATSLTFPSPEGEGLNPEGDNQSLTSSVLKPRSREVWRQMAGETEF